MATKEINYNDPASLAKYLKMFNDWRRGVGKYKWSEDPLKYNAELPITAAELGKVIDCAVRRLREYASSGEKK